MKPRPSARGEAPPASDEALAPDETLHTGDDERIDLVSSIIANAEEIEGTEEMTEYAADIISDCRKLDALLLATIRRERGEAPLPAAPEARVDAFLATYLPEWTERVFYLRKHLITFAEAPPRPPTQPTGDTP